MSLTLLQYNIFVQNEGWTQAARASLNKKVQKIAELSPSPDILFFQELVIPEMQEAYVKAFRKIGYTTARSAMLCDPKWCEKVREYGNPEDNWMMSYFPSFMFFALFLSLSFAPALPSIVFFSFWFIQTFWAPCNRIDCIFRTCVVTFIGYMIYSALQERALVCYSSDCLVGKVYTDGLAVVAFLLAVIWSPRVFRHFASTFHIAPVLLQLRDADPLGLLILVRDSGSRNGKTINIKSDPNYCGAPICLRHQACDFRPVGLVHLVNSWINMTYLYRGVFSFPIEVEMESKNRSSMKQKVRVLVATAHLQTGVVNPFRLEQIQELNAELDAEARRTNCSEILFCLDANASPNQPEMEWLMKKEGGNYIDSYHLLNPTKKGYTWDNMNPLTKGLLREPNQRIDYVLLKNQRSWRDNERKGLHLKWRASMCKVVLNDFPCDSDHFGVLAVIESTTT
eukprot:g3072.t1